MYSRLIPLVLLAASVLASDQGYICYQYINSNDKFYNLNNLATADP
jgi:hypothetical protein